VILGPNPAGAAASHQIRNRHAEFCSDAGKPPQYAAEDL
jgi:hypothetical protein